jgi:hypothetical protein
MANDEYLAFEEGGQVYQVTVKPQTLRPSQQDDDAYEDYGPQEQAIATMQRARQMIRTCAIQTVSAFRNFGVAHVEEVNLKFGIKMGGKTGLPYITEVAGEGNLEISIKCTFPAPNASVQPPS